MDFGLKDKVALVGGSSAGIGRAIARELASEGARVMLVARSEDRLKAAAEEIRDLGAQASHVSADMNTSEGVAQAVAATKALFGAPDIAVANTTPTNTFSFTTTTDEQFVHVHQQLVMSMVYLARAVIPSMQRKRWGRLVNIGSVCAKEPHRFYNLVASNTERPAVLGLNKTLSNEFSEFGITINTILPGLIDTGRFGSVEEAAGGLDEVEPIPRVPLGRPGAVEEISAVCAFLCSSRASYLTGQAISVDGGWTRSLF